MRIRTMLVAALAAISLAAACGGGSKKEETTVTATEKPLYERLGGQDAIVAVIDAFVANVAADDRINKYFANTDIPRLKTLLVEQVCAATGGPCKYTGRDMKTTHTGMKLTDADFDATVEAMVKALDGAGVQQKEKDELLGALASMKGDIVGQ